MMACILTSLGCGTFPLRQPQCWLPSHSWFMTQQLLSLDLFIVNAIYNIITVLANIPITGLLRLLCGASELIYRKGRLCRVIQRNYFPSHTETLLWKLCFKGSFNELWNMYYGFQAKSLYVCGFAVIPLWGWSSVTLNSSLFLPNISLFPSCSKPCACADYSGVALVYSSNFLSCFIWYFGCWASRSVFCCGVNQGSSQTSSACGNGAGGISPGGSGDGEGSEEWWRKAPQSAPDIRALVFLLVGQGGSEFFTVHFLSCMNMEFHMTAFICDFTN